MVSIPGKIPIRIHPFFWFLIAIIGWLSSGGTVLGTVLWAIVILYSVLIHEYGHALTALAFGQEAHIELIGFGGVTHRHGPKLKLWQEFIIVLDGPLAGVLLLSVAYFILAAYGEKLPATVVYALNITVYANIFWTIINLLPVYPLDGGKLLSIIFEAFLGIRGMKIALFLSCLFSLIVSVFLFYEGLFIGGALFLLFTIEGYRTWKGSLSIFEQDKDDAIQKLFKEATGDMQEGRYDLAEEKFEQVCKSTGRGVIYITATEKLAALLHRKGLTNEAYALLKSIENKLSPEALKLYHKIAYRIGAWQECILIGDKAYQSFPGYDVALINAFCYGVLGEAKPAIGWLQRALSDGLPNLKAILSKEEFDNIRKSPPFQEFIQKYVP